VVDGLRHLIAYADSAQWFSHGVATFLSEWIVLIAMLLLLLPLTQATALIVASTVAMPIMVADIAARDFPELERRRGGSLAGSVWNTIWVTLAFLVLWLLTLPLWLFGLPAAVLPILLTGWLNERLFRYDALAEHASREEYLQLVRRQRWPLLGLGMVAAVLQTVPVINLFAPVYSGLIFVHFGLAGLRRLRRNEADRPIAPA
jgi:uncharacterized protein involved in cysteine biosynthesis